MKRTTYDVFNDRLTVNRIKIVVKGNQQELFKACITGQGYVHNLEVQ